MIYRMGCGQTWGAPTCLCGAFPPCLSPLRSPDLQVIARFHDWLVVDLPLWKIWKSNLMIVPNIKESHKTHVPNHQPDDIWSYWNQPAGSVAMASPFWSALSVPAFANPVAHLSGAEHFSWLDAVFDATVRSDNSIHDVLTHMYYLGFHILYIYIYIIYIYIHIIYICTCIHIIYIPLYSIYKYPNDVLGFLLNFPISLGGFHHQKPPFFKITHRRPPSSAGYTLTIWLWLT